MWASTPTKMLQVVWCKSGRRGYKRCGKTGRRGNRRSAASGGRSELISRKCPDWRPQQWPGIGWHDGGQPPAPTEGLQGVRYRKKSPVTALPCQPPLGKGAEGTGVTDCHTSDIGHWFAMTGGLYMGCGARQAGDREGRPYESVTRSAVGRAGAAAPTVGRPV